MRNFRTIIILFITLLVLLYVLIPKFSFGPGKNSLPEIETIATEASSTRTAPVSENSTTTKTVVLPTEKDTPTLLPEPLLEKPIIRKIYSANTSSTYANIRAVYLTSGYVYSSSKINELLNIFDTTGANGVVIDFVDNSAPDMERMTKVVSLFREKGAYTIARIVTFQNTRFAKAHPESAIKTGAGEFWYSGKKSWQRYWLDPASPTAQNYIVSIGKQAVDAGFNEIQFDYIRFPTDGDMSDLVFPSYNPSTQTKTAVMNGFFSKLRTELLSYDPNIKMSIDIFGDVMTYGKATTIGQDMAKMADYFDVISPMSYPSHYNCGAFGVQDPTAYPYKVYNDTIAEGQKYLEGTNAIIRPWIQDFSMTSIYKCGPIVYYTKNRVLEEIQGGKDLGVNGFMLWNAGSNFTSAVFGEKL